MPPKKKKKREYKITEESFYANVSRHGAGTGIGIPGSIADKFPHKAQVYVTIQLVDDEFKERVYDAENI